MRVSMHENGLDATVRIGERTVPGYVMERQRCSDCSTPAVFQLFRQAAFCPACNRWLERHCEKSDCIYCHDRPERPR